MIKNFFSYILEIIKIVVISLIIIIPIRYYLIQPFYVKGASMEPNFYDHEYLIIDEISYRFREPQRGEIIVFKYPKNPQEYFIKRIVGLPGEAVRIEDGQVKIYNSSFSDGFVLKEEYLEDGAKTYSNTEEMIFLEEGEYFVLGDNRTSSKDSRSFGPINNSFIIGKAWLRGWPFDRAQTFAVPQYQY